MKILDKLERWESLPMGFVVGMGASVIQESFIRGLTIVICGFVLIICKFNRMFRETK